MTSLLISVLLLAILATSSSAGFAQPRISLSSIHRSQTRLLRPYELDGDEWSQNATVLGNARGLQVLHNYTVINRNARRWTKRETMDAHTFQKRGFTLDAKKFPWIIWRHLGPTKPPNPTPVDITLCFNDMRSLQELDSTVNEGICRWANALGPNAGVRFAWQANDDGSTLCAPGTKNAVVISHIPWARESTPGTIIRPYRSTLHFGSINEFPGNIEQSAVTVMTHELGHILGLEHEHQRWDAWAHLHFECDAIPHYNDVKNVVEVTERGQNLWWTDTGARAITMDDLCSYGELNARKPFNSIWGASQVIPFSKHHGDTVAPKEIGFFNDEDETFTSFMSLHGSFDPASVMIYCGKHIHQQGRGEPWFRWKDGTRLKCVEREPGERYPSQGDIDAVNFLYPPIPAALGIP